MYIEKNGIPDNVVKQTSIRITKEKPLPDGGVDMELFIPVGDANTETINDVKNKVNALEDKENIENVTSTIDDAKGEVK